MGKTMDEIEDVEVNFREGRTSGKNGNFSEIKTHQYFCFVRLIPCMENNIIVEFYITYINQYIKYTYNLIHIMNWTLKLKRN